MSRTIQKNSLEYRYYRYLDRYNSEGREGIKWELRFAFFGLEKWDSLRWDWDLTMPGKGIIKLEMGFLFLSGLRLALLFDTTAWSLLIILFS
jgi:hypothetical protein